MKYGFRDLKPGDSVTLDNGGRGEHSMSQAERKVYLAFKAHARYHGWRTRTFYDWTTHSYVLIRES